MFTKAMLKKQFPYCFTAYKNYGGDNYKTFAIAIDSLLCNYGLSIIVSPVYSGDDVKVLGHISKIKIHSENPFGIEIEQFNVIEDYKKFKSQEKANEETLRQAFNYLEEKLQTYKVE